MTVKRILLAVCGTTPQVITETLYALHQQDRMVDAVRVLTTRAGRDACLTGLFDSGQGHYYRFLAEYDLSPHDIDFQPEHVTAVRTANGLELDDIASEDDNETFLRACMEAAFQLTGVSDRSVYFSIAGGRKTMGAALTIAAQCYARPQDRIFHVLVSPQFESNRDFYYPPASSRAIELRDSDGELFTKQTSYARVTLVPLPFISIRSQLPQPLMARPESPAALLLALVREDRPELTVDLAARQLTWKGVQLDLMPAQLALYAFFVLRKKDADCDQSNCQHCTRCWLTQQGLFDYQKEITALYRRIEPRRQLAEMSTTGICNLTAENFRSYRAKLASQIRNAFGPYEAEQLTINAQGDRPSTRYGLLLDRRHIRVMF